MTSLGSEGVKYGLKVSKGVMWAFGIVVLMGLLVGAFLMVAVKKPVILVAVVAVLVPVLVGVIWNYAWGKRAILAFVKKFPDSELRGAVDGQFVKVTGVTLSLFLLWRTKVLSFGIVYVCWWRDYWFSLRRWIVLFIMIMVLVFVFLSYR